MPVPRIPSPLRFRPRAFVAARPDLPSQLPEPVSVAVIGGGIAGVSAALLLAERGARVTLLEKAPQLGGRLSAWPLQIADGTTQIVEHGFHGFFRQYYNWRSVLRRIDPELGFLKPLHKYPIVSRGWPEENFTGLPGTPPLNLLALAAKSPSLRTRQMLEVDREAMTSLLAYDGDRTYERYDDMSAADLLDSLGMPQRARSVLFDVFAHSFFNHEKEMSAAEMLMQFHFYFLRNPEGLDLDAPDQDYETAIWSPLVAQLQALGAEIRLGVAVEEIEPGFSVRLSSGTSVAAQHVVLAADPGASRRIIESSPGLAAPVLASQMAALETTAPYAVARFWLDRDLAPSRAPFSGVSQEATLDSISLYHRFERASAQWARRSGGSVVELHAYAAPAGVSAEDLAARMRSELEALWPEVAGAGVIDVDARVGQDAPSFGLGSHATRPGVRTDAPGLFLAGDWVRMPFPSALMERAAASAALAVNGILEGYGVRPEPVWSIPERGLLTSMVARQERSSRGVEGA